MFFNLNYFISHVLLGSKYLLINYYALSYWLNISIVTIKTMFETATLASLRHTERANS